MLDVISEEYQVRLEVFEGPLDLLLQLIERQEMDITQVSLARVTDQYLEHLATLQEIEAENLAEFLVIAAKLLLIKSRALLPQPPAVLEEEEKDIGEDLVEQLVLYRKFKRVAQFLQKREELGLRSYERLAPLPYLERRLEPADITPAELAETMRRLLMQREGLAPVDRIVAPLLVSINDKIAYIEEAVARQEQVSFRQLLQACTTRLEIIVTFLALLEMVRRLLIEVRQEQLFGEIVISRRLPEAASNHQEAGEDGQV